MWICSKFNREQILRIIVELNEVLQNRNPEVRPKDDFKNKYPNYRNYFVDPAAPLTTTPAPAEKSNRHWQELLVAFAREHGYPLEPVKSRANTPKVPPDTTCPDCHAPAEYLYFNDGKKRSQIRCKVCEELFQLGKRHQTVTKSGLLKN